ncbi:MAG: hypothetical protein IT294_06185 [Deltaproteobacteria bacterium]|nr:hypothetical protein [Deltaproteobacteria bacterium]
MVKRTQRTLVWLVVAVLIGVVDRAEATQKFGPLELSGNVQSQQLIRHPDIDQYYFVQQRNTLRVRVDYEWMKRGGKFLDRYDLSDWIESSHLFLLYRGVYDSIYDLTPGFTDEFEYTGEKIDKRYQHLDDMNHGWRNAMKYENDLREAYVDIKFRGNFSLRAGKQQIIWGESDGFRLLDRANALDLSWHFFYELPPPAFGLDDLRVPFWMIKGLYDFGSVGSWSNVFAEAYWNPGDWSPSKLSFLPNPWGVRLGNPLTNPRSGAFYAVFSGIERLNNGTSLRQGNYDRNPIDNSQFGIRFNGVTGPDTPILPEGLQIQIGYLYQRFMPSGGATSSAALARGIPPTEAGQIRTQELVSRGTLPVEFYTPYIHTIGIAANYFDEWTKIVWRTEQAYDFGIPFYSCAHDADQVNRRLDAGQRACTRDTTFAPFLPGIRNHDVWSGLIAFDRPTWIRPLNKKTTFFITGQLFHTYMIQKANSTIGGLDLPTKTKTIGQAKPIAYRDDIHRWEMLMTFAIIGFYRGGSVAPAFIYLLDPVNSYSQAAIWGVDYFVTPNFAVNLSQRFIINPTREINFEPWGIAGLNRGRSETGIRFTYQF